MDNKFITLIFSYDRPAQLDLTLNTNHKYCIDHNLRNEWVLYKVSNDDYNKAYIQLAKEYPSVHFIMQGNFKIDVCKLLDGYEYVLFVVDDCIFTRSYSIHTLLSFLDMCEGALGFSLRLGTNTKYCYSFGLMNDMPRIQPMGKNIMAFSWKEVTVGDFAYPLELSSSAYRVNDIKPILEKTNYNTPNSLEWNMYQSLPYFLHKPFLLSFEISVAFCNPINKVQTENNNRSGENSDYSVDYLLKLYKDGYRINPVPFEGFISNACHQEQEIEYYKK